MCDNHLRPESYPGCQFTDAALARLDACNAFIDGVAWEHRDLLRGALHDKLTYLSEYGGPAVTVHLMHDFAALSFGFDIMGPNGHWFSGGLIWHGGTNDPLCVAGSATLWGVHT